MSTVSKSTFLLVFVIMIQALPFCLTFPIDKKIKTEGTIEKERINPQAVGVFPGNSRELFSDFYYQKMGSYSSSQPSSSSSLNTSSYDGNISKEEGQDFGEKFTQAVAEAAVALGDVGILTAKKIIKEVGAEFLYATAYIGRS